VYDDLAARDLGLVGDHRVELLVAQPAGDDVRRLLALLRSLEEAERAEDAVVGLDQPVARKPREPVQLRTSVALTLRVNSAARFWSTPS
jgi:hypothetical protein